MNMKRSMVTWLVVYPIVAVIWLIGSLCQLFMDRDEGSKEGDHRGIEY